MEKKFAPKVLIVHTSVCARICIRVPLMRKHRVRGVSCGETALSVFRMGFFDPDLVIINYALSKDMSGMKLLGALREKTSMRAVPFFSGPVVVLGASETAERTRKLETLCARRDAVYMSSFSCWPEDLARLARIVNGQLDPYGSEEEGERSLSTKV
ncbi:hypothetical protein K2X96_00695 [Patescibacteria group bacterium]|nr:hypothetical protein [Patescibacteria group bacterium]